MKKRNNGLIGGFISWAVDINGNRSKEVWQYECCYESIRICKGSANGKLIVPGVTYSLHFNTYANRGPKWIPNCLRNKASHHHVAFIKQWPFIVIGFNNVEKYIEYFN